MNTKNGFPVFATVIEANYVTKKQDLFSAYKLTQEDKEEIEKLAKDPRIGERVRTCALSQLKVRLVLSICRLSQQSLFLMYFYLTLSDIEVHCSIHLWSWRHKDCLSSCDVWWPREKCWRKTQTERRHKYSSARWSGHCKITVPQVSRDLEWPDFESMNTVITMQTYQVRREDRTASCLYNWKRSFCCRSYGSSTQGPRHSGMDPWRRSTSSGW